MAAAFGACPTPTHVLVYGTPPREGSVDVFNAVTVASALLSLLGSAFIVVTYHRVVTLRSAGMRTVYWLSVADLAASVFFVIDGSTDSSCTSSSSFCTLKAAGSQFFGLAAILWTGSIALNLDLTVLRHARIAQQVDRLMRRLHAGVWGTSAAVLLVAYLADTLGPAGGGWCWVKATAQWARAAFWYVPLLLSIAYTVVIYFRTRATLLHLHREASRSAGALSLPPPPSSTLGGLTSRLRALLVVFVVINAAQIANRLHGFFSASPSYELSLLHALLGPLQAREPVATTTHATPTAT